MRRDACKNPRAWEPLVPYNQTSSDAASLSWFERRSLAFWASAVLFVLLLALLRTAAQALLLTFGAVLFGNALRGLAHWLARRTRWNMAVCVTLNVALILVISVLIGFWVIPQIAHRAAELASKLQQAYDSARSTLKDSPAGPLLTDSAGVRKQLGELVSSAAGILTSGFGLLGSLIFVLMMALYVAADAPRYAQGLVRLVPVRRRARARELLSALASTQRRWLIGRMVSMTAVGALTTFGLYLLHVPLPVTLGLLAAALGFVPNIGPIVSVVPAALLASTQGAVDILYVLMLYLALNFADGYVLTPWIQRRAVAVPPALILSGQVVLGTVWGVLGVMFATPLLACLLVLVRELYVHDVLEREQS
jgi:predicted PurR-regulated permease PerM